MDKTLNHSRLPGEFQINFLSEPQNISHKKFILQPHNAEENEVWTLSFGLKLVNSKFKT
jgi:hypothetical protein